MKSRKGLLAFWQWGLALILVLALVCLTAPARANTIAGGGLHSLGVKADGTVVAWGYNSYGQINVPDGLSGVVAVAGGGAHSLTLRGDGTVVAWGNPWDRVPADLSGVVAVAAGGVHSLAVKADGTVVAWGDWRNDMGAEDVPAGLSGVVAVAGGGMHSIALRADGTVVAWGYNAAGQCNVPDSLSGVVAVAAGHSHNLALKADGTVVAWGWDYWGQCDAPAGLSGVAAVAAGGHHSLALKADGTVVAWGYNGWGECDVPAGLGGVVAVAAGTYHSLALKDDGSVVGWGDNQFGQCNAPAGVTFMPPNRPPQAKAGGNRSILSQDQATTTLTGSATDADSDALTYRWVEGETALTSWQPVVNGLASLNLGALPIFTLTEHYLTLEVSDGKVTARDDMVLTLGNSAPNAAPSGGGTYEVNAQVSLGGQVSDFDGDPLTYRWLKGGVELSSGAVSGIQGGEPVNLTPFLVSNLPVGDYEFILEVKDLVNAPVSKSVMVKVIDNIAPSLAPTADKTILWPPNKQMVPVTIKANAGDNSGLPVTLTATVSCNEPNEGSPYWTEPAINQATGIITLQLQADRLGKGKGRQYTIGINATDQSGNLSTATVVVSVPHDQGKN